MKAFRSVTSTAVVLDRPDVDTDQIIPKQFLKRIERSGYGEFLFFDWMKDPDFELNRPENQDAQILVAGRNFGCGSPAGRRAAGAGAGAGGGARKENELTVDLEALEITHPGGLKIAFTLDPYAR